MSIESQFPDHPPAEIGRRYRLHERIGRGGMGVVYRATDRLTGQDVALKRVRTQAQTQAAADDNTFSFRMSLTREFQLAASLRHPHIVKLLDYGFDMRGEPYYTMEMLPGARNLIEAAADRDDDSRMHLLLQMLEALAYLHRRNILHRDLKPANLLVVDDHLTIVDFGISLVRNTSGFGNDDFDGLITGTMPYMPPESFGTQKLREAADLYAVGMIAYELFAGAYPFDRSNMIMLMQAILFDMPDADAIQAPAAVREIIMRLLAKEPEERYQSAAAVLEDLYAALGRAPAENVAIRDSFLKSARFVGRQMERDRLTADLQAAIDGQGRACLIAGESGVGKSRLVDEVRTLAMVRGCLVMRGIAAEVAQRPYGLWSPILRWLCLLSPDLDDELVAILKPFIPDLALLAERDIHDIAPQVLPQDAFQARIVAWLLATLSQQAQPTVILLEDLHWAGSESLALLARVVDVLGDLPLLVVGSYREEEAPHLSDDLPAVPVLRLTRLDDLAVEELSAAILGDEVGRNPQVMALLQRETAGNALFIVEVMRALAEEVGPLSQIDRSALPQQVTVGGVDAILRRRLQRINALDRRLLDAAAIMGRQVNMPVLLKLAHDSAMDVEAWLTRMTNIAVLERQDDVWQFSHDRLRRAVVTDMPDEARRYLHRQVAAIFAQRHGNDDAYSEILAYHHGQAGDIQREAHYSTRAGHRALSLGAFDEGVRYFRRALHLLDMLRMPDDERQRRRMALLQQQAEAHIGIAEYSTARDLFAEALELSHTLGDPATEAAATSRLGDIALVLGFPDDARTLYEHCLALYRHLDNQQGVALTLHHLGDVAFEVGAQDDAMQYYRESLKLSREIGADWGMAGGLRRTQERKALAEMPAPDTDSTLRKRTTLEIEIGTLRDSGDYSGAAAKLLVLGDAAASISSAMTAYRQALALYKQSADAMGEALARRALAEVEIAREHFDQAWSHLRAALGLVRDLRAPDIFYPILVVMARAWLAQSDPAAAVPVLSFVLHAADTPDIMEDEAEHLLLQIEDQLPSDQVTSLYERGKTLSQEAMIAHLLGA